MKFICFMILLILSACSDPVLPEQSGAVEQSPVTDPVSLVRGTGTGPTYWLSPDGSDTTGDGSFEKPWRTINWVSNKLSVKPGTTINLRGGTYLPDRSAWFGDSGTDSAWITIQSAPGEQAILDGSNLDSGKMIFTVGGAYVSVKNLILKNGPKSGMSIRGGSFVELESLTVSGCQGPGIYAGYSDRAVTRSVQIRSCTVTDNCRSNTARPDFGSGWPGAVLVQKSTGATVWNCRVYENYGEGIIFGESDSGLCQDNDLRDNFSIHIYLDNSQYTLVQNNFCHTTNNPEYFRFAQACNSLQMNNEKADLYLESRGNVLRNNLCIGGRTGFTYWKDAPGGLKSCQIYGNSFIGCTETGVKIYADSHNSTQLFNNLILVNDSADQFSVPDLAGLQFDHNGWTNPAGIDDSGEVSAPSPFAVLTGDSPDLWRLPENSPFRQSGTVSGAFGRDFFRSKRSGTAPSIGAIE